MATYNLENVGFDIDGSAVTASGDVMKDGELLQSFAVSIKPVKTVAELVKQVADHVRPIVERDILISDIFAGAIAILEGKEIVG